MTRAAALPSAPPRASRRPGSSAATNGTPRNSARPSRAQSAPARPPLEPFTHEGVPVPLGRGQMEARALSRALAASLPVIERAAVAHGSATPERLPVRLQLRTRVLTVTTVSGYAAAECAVASDYHGPERTAYLSLESARQIERALRSAGEGVVDLAEREGGGLELRHSAADGKLHAWTASAQTSFPAMEPLWQKVNATPALTGGQICLNAKVLRPFTLAAEAIAKATGRTAMLRLVFFGPDQPVLVEVDPGFRGLAMPMTDPRGARGAGPR